MAKPKTTTPAPTWPAPNWLTGADGLPLLAMTATEFAAAQNAVQSGMNALLAKHPHPMCSSASPLERLLGRKPTDGEEGAFRGLEQIQREKGDVGDRETLLAAARAKVTWAEESLGRARKILEQDRGGFIVKTSIIGSGDDMKPLIKALLSSDDASRREQGRHLMGACHEAKGGRDDEL